MKKVLSIFGTRPEAIKMAPIVKELENSSDKIESKVCITAQHREMLDQVLDFFQIKPHYDLNIMKSDQDLYDITSKLLILMRDVLDDFNPDLILVHGDTTTSTTAALAAFYKKIPVAHIEAGLRTGNIYSPWPEEMNRKITGSLASYHFSPTSLAKENLVKENVKPDQIFVTGNTIIDALLYSSNILKQEKDLETSILKEFEDIEGKNIKELVASQFILVTGHRRENFGEGFIQICEAIRQIAFDFPNINIIYPVHLNPNVKKPVYELLGDIANIYLIPPLSYLPFIYLLEKCYLVLTDSGGIQEEAPSFGKPVLVMRDTTERPEAVECGTVKLVGTNKELIISVIQNLLTNKSLYNTMSESHNPYGDGKAAKRIVEKIMEILA